jgi:hypothetical protein
VRLLYLFCHRHIEINVLYIKMDPLSVAASVAGLITIAETVVNRGFKLGKIAKNAEREIARLIAEVTNLFGVLHSLHLVVLRFEDEAVDGKQ